MKKHIASLSLILLTESFSFYRMEGPFKLIFPLKLKYPSNIKYNKNINNASCVHPNTTHKILLKNVNSDYPIFFYDHNTKHVLFNPYNIKETNFLDYLMDQVLIRPFIVKYALTTYSKNGYTPQSINKMINLFHKNTSNNSSNKIPILIPYCENDRSITRNFMTSSGIFISHDEDKPTITKKENTVYFQDALLKYYNYIQNYNQHYVKIVNAIDQGKYYIPYVQKKIMNELIESNKAIHSNFSITTLLKNSKIITALAVFKNDDNQEAIIFGTAIDNQTQELFFWITDLKDDISILMNQ